MLRYLLIFVFIFHPFVGKTFNAFSSSTIAIAIGENGNDCNDIDQKILDEQTFDQLPIFNKLNVSTDVQLLNYPSQILGSKKLSDVILNGTSVLKANKNLVGNGLSLKRQFLKLWMLLM